MSNSKPESSPRPPETPLQGLRERIDSLDDQLLKLLQERARIVIEVGNAKRAEGVAIYSPHREKEVLDRLLARRDGPLPPRTIEAIWRELMSGSFGLELPLRVGFLGPKGTFSHIATLRHFGSSVELAELESIESVFEEVERGRCHHGLVPYENAIGGGIVETLDAFQDHEVRICAEAMVLVNQCLLSVGSPAEVKRICSRGEVFAQCRKWIAQRFPGAKLVPVASTAAAAMEAANDPSTAAIGSSMAGQMFGLNALFEGIEDHHNNITRFLVLGRESAKPTGEDRTTIMFATANRPGALVDVLDSFRKHGVNLSHIDKRPSGQENWTYTFFIDADAHESDAALQAALATAKPSVSTMRVLGSYPRATRTL
ncbi:MAG: prephenate dehydratase [Planctomycetes bacterium]|nr:prephenate dehydratase [Planctomycetota bacterium]